MSQETHQLCGVVFKTSLGWFGVVWKGSVVARLTFGHETRKEAIAAIAEMGDVTQSVSPDRCPDRRLVARLQDYADGGGRRHDPPDAVWTAGLDGLSGDSLRENRVLRGACRKGGVSTSRPGGWAVHGNQSRPSDCALSSGCGSRGSARLLFRSGGNRPQATVAGP